MRYKLYLIPEKGGRELEQQLCAVQGCVEFKIEDLSLCTTPDLAQRIHTPTVASAIEKRLKLVTKSGVTNAREQPLPPVA